MVKRIPVPPARKKIIYLDQYVVSNPMKLDNLTLQRTDKLAADPFWKELKDLLTELRDLQLIVCPDSASNVSESRISQFNAELKKTYEVCRAASPLILSLRSVTAESANLLAHGLSNVIQSSILIHAEFYPMIRTSGMSGPL